MKYLVVLFAAILFTSCVKDKLEANTLILEGTWTWDHSVEYTYDSANDTVLTTVISASNYTDTYGIRFEEKGHIYTLKNGNDEEKYRNILPHFKQGLCIDLHNAYEYKIKLNNKDADTLAGCVNADTLVTNDLHLPLSKGNSEYPYYKHYFVK